MPTFIFIGIIGKVTVLNRIFYFNRLAFFFFFKPELSNNVLVSFLALHPEITFSGIQGTRWNVRDRTHVRYMQSKCPSCPWLSILFLLFHNENFCHLKGSLFSPFHCTFLVPVVFKCFRVFTSVL